MGLCCSKKVTALPAKWQAKEENVNSQYGKPRNNSQRERVTHTHTSRGLDTHLVFTPAILPYAPKKTAGLWGVLTRVVFVFVRVSLCVFILSFGSHVKLNHVVL